MARDVGARYSEVAVGKLTPHKFEEHTCATTDDAALLGTGRGRGFKYLLEVYVDDFMSLDIPTLEGQL